MSGFRRSMMMAANSTTSGSLSGFVLNEIGNAISSAQLTITIDGNTYTSTSGSNGEYSFTELPQGTGTIVITATNCIAYSGSITIDAGSNFINYELRVALPTGYTRYDYALFSGGGNNNISLTITNNTKVIIRCKGTDASADLSACGMLINNGTPAYQGIRFDVKSGSARVLFGAGETGADIATSFVNFADSTIAHELEVSSAGFYIDGTKVADVNQESFSVSDKWAIGTVWLNSYVTSRRFKGYIDWVKIYDNGVLSRYFVPCKNSSNADRFRDIVKGSDLSKGGSYSTGNY